MTLSYVEALTYIQGFADFEVSPDPVQAATRFNLERLARLCELVGMPQDRFKSLHVAGTKGKGSTAAMLDSILRAAGYRTGLFTSPHLHDFRERIRVNGGLITEDEVAAIVALLQPLVDELHRRHPELGRLTTFEAITALAFVQFAEQNVDFAVLETGLGGRLDATNVVEPLVAVITSISYDHTQVLGKTLTSIATEKAGIIKPGATVVCAPQEDEAMAVIEAACRERGARLGIVGRDWRWEGTNSSLRVTGPFGTYDNLRVPLLGAHQIVNATTAVAAIDALRWNGIEIAPEHICEGLASVRWPGRLEVMSRDPLVVVDGAHNADSARKLIAALRECFSFRRLILVLGTSMDKDIAGIVRETAPHADMVIITKSLHPRAATLVTLQAEVSKHKARADRTPALRAIATADDVAAALRLARAEAAPDDLICVTGSLFVVAQARECLGFRSIL